jgi:hypothetical protein
LAVPRYLHGSFGQLMLARRRLAHLGMVVALGLVERRDARREGHGDADLG